MIERRGSDGGERVMEGEGRGWRDGGRGWRDGGMEGERDRWKGRGD